MTTKKWELCKCFLKVSSATQMKGVMKVGTPNCPVESGAFSLVAGPLSCATSVSNTNQVYWP